MDAALEARISLQHDVEQLYYAEAHALDDRRFEDWLELFTDDLRYRMPMARNVVFKDADREYLEGDLDVSWMDEDKETLSRRVAQIRTGVHWAEEPLSRTAHLVSNVYISEAPEDVDVDGVEITVRVSFLSYRHRLSDQEDTIVGRRRDVLRRVDGVWRIAQRNIYINQTVYLGRSLSHFV